MKKVFLQQNTCYLCGSDHHRLLFSCRSGLEAHLCQECGLIFAARRFDPDALGQYLKNGYSEKAGDLTQAWEQTFRVERARRRVDFLRTGVKTKPPIRLLEIGSYIGHFLWLAQEEGWQVTGLEPDPEVAVFAREKAGAPVEVGLVADYVKDNKRQFDLVCMFHVLEHIPQPVRVLRALHGQVGVNNYLCLEVPNADSCGEGDWPQFFEADETHQWFFGQRTLGLMLGQAGFHIEKAAVVPAHAGPRGALLVLARAVDHSDPVDPAASRNPTLVRKLYQRLLLKRLNWRFGTGPWWRLYRRLRLVAWHVVKGRRRTC